MITGCEKRVIVIKNTGSDIFEEAYFIVKSTAVCGSKIDFLCEANRIIGSRNVEIRKRKRRLLTALLVPVCFLSGAAFALLAIFIFA